MEIKVIKAGENVVADGDSYKPTGCVQCHNIVPEGEILVLIDDKEYFPTFCKTCINALILEFWRRR